GRAVGAARPVVELESHPALERLVTVEDQRGAARGEAVLVEIRRDRRHLGDPEVERRDGLAELAKERQGEAAHARVDVEMERVPPGDLGDGGDRIDRAERVVGRGGHQTDGVLVHRVGHRLHVGHVVLGDRGPDVPDAEDVGRLVEGGMRARRQHQLGPRDLWSLGPRALLGRAHAQDDALRPAGGDVARAIRAAEQLRAHGDQLPFERGEALEDPSGAEPVGGHEERVRLLQETQVLRPHSVDEAERPAFVPGEIAGHGPLQRCHHVRARLSLGRQLHGVLPWAECHAAPRSSSHPPTRSRTKEAARSTLARAFTRGAMPSFSRLQMYMVSVPFWPDTKKVMRNSSIDSVNTKRAAPITPGRMRGRVTCQKTRAGVAPRSPAARSSERSKPYRRVDTMRIANGTVNTTWPSTMVSRDRGRRRKAKKSSRATPMRKCGITIGTMVMAWAARLSAKVQRTSGKAASVPTSVDVTVVIEATTRLL